MSDIDKFEDVMALLPTGALLLDAQGCIQKANGQAVDAMGIPTDKLLGVPLGELLVPEYGDMYETLLEAADDTPRFQSVRLARALAPLELTFKAAGDGYIAVGVRSMELEYQLSAKAGAELTHDAVTGLPDHYHVLSQLHSRMSVDNPKPLALLCIWVDELPTLTTSHGERAVERVVREVGERLQLRLRAPDTLGRFDTAGFLALLTSDAPTDQLTQIADRLRDEIAFPVNFDKKLVSFSASVALASIVDKQPSIERVLALLEASGNRAISTGGNRTDILQL